MTPSRLTSRVTADACALAVALAAAALWLGGTPAALGVAAGGGLALLNFRWLAARAASAATAGGIPGAGWYVRAGLRFAVVTAAVAALFLTGAAHPVALVVGLTALPCALIARGLAAARREG
jgi:hypothetical protein